MRVQIHDSLKSSSRRREDFIQERITETLERFYLSIHRVDLSLGLEGHNGTARIHCHIAANLASLGTVVSDFQTGGEDAVHHAVNGALRTLIRGIEKKLGKRQNIRHTPAVPEAIPEEAEA
ncbi:MAG: hypothetical protein VB858_16015 [Planctomycetaceae bacterium]|jgi:ribosome-associated translation inhibitor RaiA